MKDSVEGSRPTRAQRTAIADAELKLKTYFSQAFAPDGSTLHSKSKDAAYSVQCPPPPGFEDTGITNFKCASGDCDVCGLNLPDSGLYCRPCLEEDILKPIKYYSFKNLPICSHCGALPDGSKTCSNCVEKTELENKRGKIRKRKHLTWNNTPLSVFNKLYDETLPKYMLHGLSF